MATAVVEQLKRRATYEDYAKLPEGAPYQLIGGELVMTPSPATSHQRILGNLYFELRKFVTENNAGEVFNAPYDVYLDEENVVQPDILFVSKERLHIIGEKNIQGAPDLVIEILSESTAYYDMKHKKRLYERFGVREYWIVDPMGKSIEVYENVNGAFVMIGEATETGRVNSKLLAGFGVDLERVFHGKN